MFIRSSCDILIFVTNNCLLVFGGEIFEQFDTGFGCYIGVDYFCCTGFKSFLGFLSSVFVSILSVFVAQKISLFVYDSFMYPYLEKTIEKLISETGLNAFEVFHKIPRFIASFLEARGITPQELNHIMNNSVSSTIPQKISQIIKPGILSVLKSLCICGFVNDCEISFKVYL